jgi:hypothetical protein
LLLLLGADKKEIKDDENDEDRRETHNGIGSRSGAGGTVAGSGSHGMELGHGKDLDG